MPEIKLHKLDDIKLLFEKQKKELTESLKYASYIQKALLPADSLLKRHFPEHFLIYMPCSIVSGDFYWLSRKKNYLYFALADCTGHGVPGAFLSIMGISFLNQIVDRNPDFNASMILNSLREYIMKALHQTGDIHEQKDGIDMAFCKINLDSNILHYAGAFSSIYVIKNTNQLIEVPGDKMPIGVAAEEEISFTNQEIELNKGDLVYLFSDGYVDQFGGSDEKKFKFKPFRNLLLSVCTLSLEQQKEKIIKKHIEWRGKSPQLDDISVFCFRYNNDKPV